MSKTIFLLFALGSCGAMYGTSLTPGTPCLTGTVADYETLYGPGAGTCSVGQVTYSNFTIIYSSPAAIPQTGSDMIVTPVSSSGNGFSFTYGPVTSTVSFELQYDFDPPPAIGSAEIRIATPPGGPPAAQGGVDAFESICPGSTFATGCSGISYISSFSKISSFSSPAGLSPAYTDPVPVTLDVHHDFNGEVDILDDSAPIDPPVTNGEIQLSLTLDGTPTDPAGFQGLGVTESFAAPEPETFSLLFIGLALVIACRFAVIRKRAL